MRGFFVMRHLPGASRSARYRACSLATVISALLSLSAAAPACANEAAAKPLPPDTLTFLQKKNIAAQAPVYIRIFKEESELEVWKERPGGRFVLVKTYPICNWSGALGPKEALGDLMAPEGFYSLAPAA